MRITWDEVKDGANQRKHGVGFAEAAQLFLSGVDYLELFDDAHADDEDRFLAIGPIARGLVVVVWTQREDDHFRIISARLASRREQALFHEFMGFQQ